MELIDLFINPDLTDESGVSAIATVNEPAHNSGFHAFNKQKGLVLKKHIIQLASKKGDLKPVEGEQQMLYGAFLIPDIEIPRIDENGKEYSVRFSKEQVKLIAEKWALRNINTKLNEMHNSELPLEGGVVQHFIIDSKNGITSPFKMNFVDGVWAGFIKVLDKNKYDAFIKTGIYTGFSVEGQFYEKVASEDSEFMVELEKLLSK
jgi:hypothetical protein